MMRCFIKGGDDHGKGSDLRNDCGREQGSRAQLSGVSTERRSAIELNVRAFALAVGASVAAGFSVCLFFVTIAPEATAKFIGYLLHINLTGLSRPISWGSYLAGVLALAIWTALWASVAAALYNVSLRK